MFLHDDLFLRHEWQHCCMSINVFLQTRILLVKSSQKGITRGVKFACNFERLNIILRLRESYSKLRNYSMWKRIERLKRNYSPVTASKIFGKLTMEKRFSKQRIKCFKKSSTNVVGKQTTRRQLCCLKVFLVIAL